MPMFFILIFQAYAESRIKCGGAARVATLERALRGVITPSPYEGGVNPWP